MASSAEIRAAAWAAVVAWENNTPPPMSTPLQRDAALMTSSIARARAIEQMRQRQQRRRSARMVLGG